MKALYSLLKIIFENSGISGDSWTIQATKGRALNNHFFGHRWDRCLILGICEGVNEATSRVREYARYE